MTTARSSRDHCLACLTRLAAVTGKPKRSEGEARVVLEAYVERLQRYEPEVVQEACRRAEERFALWPKLAELLPLCEEVKAERDAELRAHALPAPPELDRCLEEALRFLPPWVQIALDYPTERNGGTPWRALVDRREILRAIARVWQARVPPPQTRTGLPEDWRSRADFAHRLAEALAAAIQARDLGLVRPGGELCPEWRDQGLARWSHDGLRRLVQDLQLGRCGAAKDLAVAVLARHLEAGRMPADVADRAIALVHGRPDTSDAARRDGLGPWSYTGAVVECGHDAA